MSLSEEERNALVTLQMEKARTFLQQADESGVHRKRNQVMV